MQRNDRQIAALFLVDMSSSTKGWVSTALKEALILMSEALAVLGIHPFCITVDKEAHAYMDHMYGEVNYIFIDRIEKLPLRIPEIYRTFTT